MLQGRIEPPACRVPAGASLTDQPSAWNFRCATVPRSIGPKEASSPCLWLWIGSEKACPVTAQGIWAFSPEKCVFPGFLRTGAHPAPGLGVQNGREGEMDWQATVSDLIICYWLPGTRLSQQGPLGTAFSPRTQTKGSPASHASVMALALLNCWQRNPSCSHRLLSPGQLSLCTSSVTTGQVWLTRSRSTG